MIIKKIIMTLIGPDLDKIQKFTKNYILEKEVIKDIGLELLNLLEYIHENKIIYRDIKPKNIFWACFLIIQ